MQQSFESFRINCHPRFDWLSVNGQSVSLKFIWMKKRLSPIVWAQFYFWDFFSMKNTFSISLFKSIYFNTFLTTLASKFCFLFSLEFYQGRAWNSKSYKKNIHHSATNFPKFFLTDFIKKHFLFRIFNIILTFCKINQNVSGLGKLGSLHLYRCLLKTNINLHTEFCMNSMNINSIVGCAQFK